LKIKEEIMGLIRAAVGAIGSTLHDQWKEAIRCEDLGNEILMKKVSTPTNVISAGSTIIVQPGQCAIIVDNGKVIDATAEEGVYKFDESSTPSFFAGQFKNTFKEMFGFTWEFFVRILKVSLPVFGHEIMWVSGVSIYVVIYGRMGTEPAAAVEIVKSISNLIFTLLFGLSSASSAIIGNEIGAGNEEGAYKTAIALLKASVVLAVIISISVYLFSPILLNIMHVKPGIYPLTKQILISEMFIIICKSMGTILIVGILRAGGDTLWTMFADLLPLWLVAIPITYIAGLKLGLPISIVYLFSVSDEVVKFVPCLRRLRSKKWINNLVK